jgi:nitrogen fixation/metabolism regulation signal transduction histidine kinase
VIRSIGRTERRVVSALLVTAILPLLVAMWLANNNITYIGLTAFHPEFETHLDRSLGLYKDLVQSMKRAMQNEGEAMAADEALRDAATAGDSHAISDAMKRVMKTHDTLLSLRAENPDGEVLAEIRSGREVAEPDERPYSVNARLGRADDAPILVATFAADDRRRREMDEAQKFSQMYKSLSKKHRAEILEKPHLRGFAGLLSLTVIFAVIMGVVVVRPLIRRIQTLADATRPVAEGDLSVRVDDVGRDELADLARAFNQMLGQLGQSRARIEFLKRVGEWQQMARRLAHEIKNPLTPIQLAVEECHRRYPGGDENYEKLLATTLDIVVEEVASLRRLVGEFAAFARLPRADLHREDLRTFLEEQRPRVEGELRALAEAADAELDLEYEVGSGEMEVGLDRTMLYRVLSNLVANAAQATLADDGQGKVRVCATRHDDHCELVVEDDGPGIPDNKRQSIFDPYMTTKTDGTGLGLTIVKKVIIDHGGHIDVDTSPLGGARFCVHLPLWGTSAAEAVLSQAEAYPISG